MNDHEGGPPQEGPPQGGPPQGGPPQAGPPQGQAAAVAGITANAGQTVLLPLKPNHVIHLKTDDQVDLYMDKAESHICQYPNYRAELEGTSHPGQASATRQEHILNFLVQTVEHPLAFQEIKTICNTQPAEGSYSRRGYLAWQKLKEFFYNQGTTRLMRLQNKMQMKQGAGELGGVYVTRVLNARAELKDAGMQIDDLAVKTHLIQGVRKEYRPFISDLFQKLRDMSLENVAEHIRRAALAVEEQQEQQAAEDAVSAHLGAVQDPFAFQQPPSSAPTLSAQQPPPANPLAMEPAQTAMISCADLRSYLSCEKQHFSDAAWMALERGMMAVSIDQRKCYTCGQPGHLSYNCPHRPPTHAPSGRPQPTPYGPPSYPHPQMLHRPHPMAGSAPPRPPPPAPTAAPPRILQRTFNNVPGAPDLSGRAPIRPPALQHHSPPPAPQPTSQPSAAHYTEDDWGFYDSGMMDFNAYGEYSADYGLIAHSYDDHDSPFEFHSGMPDDICDDTYPPQDHQFVHSPHPMYLPTPYTLLSTPPMIVTPNPWEPVDPWEEGLADSDEDCVILAEKYPDYYSGSDDDSEVTDKDMALTFGRRDSPTHWPDAWWLSDDSVDLEVLPCGEEGEHTGQTTTGQPFPVIPVPDSPAPDIPTHLHPSDFRTPAPYVIHKAHTHRPSTSAPSETNSPGIAGSRSLAVYEPAPTASTTSSTPSRALNASANNALSALSARDARRPATTSPLLQPASSLRLPGHFPISPTQHG